MASAIGSARFFLRARVTVSHVLVSHQEGTIMLAALDLDAALRGYVECALWTESCNGQADHDADRCRGEDCDTSLYDIGYEIDHVTPESLDAMRGDLVDFIDGCLSERPDAFDGMDSGQIGHDFWLTRNRHGAGFWDRGLGERGDYLTTMSKPYGDAWLYVGDDDQVHVG